MVWAEKLRTNPAMGARKGLRRDRLSRRTLAYGFLLSVGVHVGFFLTWRGASFAPLESAQVEEAGLRPKLFAGALVGVRIRVESREIPPPPRPRLVLETPEVTLREPLQLMVTPMLAKPPGKPAGSSAKPGASSARPGSGGGSVRVTPPVPRSVLPEWEPPSSVRGMQVMVRVLVDVHGVPTGAVQLIPPTPDPSFNRRLAEKVSRMEFHPARRGGVPIPAWAEITFVF